MIKQKVYNSSTNLFKTDNTAVDITQTVFLCDVLLVTNKMATEKKEGKSRTI